MKITIIIMIHFSIIKAGQLPTSETYQNQLRAHNWNLIKVPLAAVIILISQVRLQICTCHNSSAVVTCANLWSDLVIIFYVRTTHTFSRFGLWPYKPFMNGSLVTNEAEEFSALSNRSAFSSSLLMATNLTCLWSQAWLVSLRWQMLLH